MSLRDRLHRSASPQRSRRRLFETYGFVDNPFPAAGQPSGHPHLEGEADDRVASAVEQFERDGRATQVLVIEGTQGVGKTNLLNYYQGQLEDLYRGDETFYIIRYYPDPEPSFDAIVRKVFQELEPSHLEEVGRKLAQLSTNDAEQAIDEARSHEVRIVLQQLKKAAVKGDQQLAEVARDAMEWFVGLRLLNKHRESLGVQFRLDTVEAKTQALRDVVFVSDRLGLLKGIFLLLDELEKQDYSLSKTPVLRYLSAIRALIDALPRNLFLMLALTSDARQRYFEMLPAIASRLQNRAALSPLTRREEATKYFRFYQDQARARAKQHADQDGWRQGGESILSGDEVGALFSRLLEASTKRGSSGVSQRDFLNALHVEVEQKISALL